MSVDCLDLTKVFLLLYLLFKPSAQMRLYKQTNKQYCTLLYSTQTV